jgi:hypothetical protein
MMMAPIATSIGIGLPAARAPLTAAENVTMPENFQSAGYQPAPPSRFVSPALQPPHLLSRMSGRPQELQGVDLRLDQFDLSAPKKVSLEAERGSLAKPVEECAAVGELFWKSLEGSSQALRESDRQLLRDIFNPALSDRRSEGDSFVPPDTSASYIARLRNLVKEEESVRLQRCNYFFSEDFTTLEPGPLFPSSWRPAFEIARDRDSAEGSEERPRGALRSRPDFIGLPFWEEVLQDTEADFDKCTEEGWRFRVYQLGCVEVRTVQEPNGMEEVGAIFSSRPESAVAPARKGSKKSSASSSERIVKVTEYVEASRLESILVDGVRKSASDAGLFRHYFVVLETDEGNRIVSEQLSSGRATWQLNPDDLEYRTSLAKVLRYVTCRDGAWVKDVKRFQQSQSQKKEASQSACKWYARGVYSQASGEALKGVVSQPLGEVEQMRQLYKQAQAQSKSGMAHRRPADLMTVPSIA